MTNNLSERHLSDLRSSGLADEIINLSGCYSCNAKKANELLDRKDVDCDCLVFPYIGTDYSRLKPDGIVLGSDGKPAKYLSPYKQRSRLYILPEIRNKLYDKNCDLPILLTEGEKKTLKAYAEIYTKEQICIPIGLAGVWNWVYTSPTWNDRKKVTENKRAYIEDIEKVDFGNRIVYICFDSDIILNEQVQNAESALAIYIKNRGALRVLSVRIPHEDYKLGIDDYLVKYGLEDFKKLIKNASASHIVKAEIKLLRANKDIARTEKLEKISSRVIQDQKSVGKFYVNESGTYYYSNTNRQVYQIEDEIYSMYLAHTYGLFRGDQEFSAVLTKVEEEASFNGRNVNISNFSTFCEGKLHTYNNNGGMYVVTKDKVEFKFNGFDDVFFKHKLNIDELKYIPNSKGYFQKYFLDIANFRENDYTNLTTEQQKILFTTWFYSLFFPNLMPTKPILVMTGDYQSGKSTIQRLTGKLLFGPSFNVTVLQSEKDFFTSIINKHYLVYDNVDITEKWVRDAIASLSTGFKIELRKLYTNLEMFEASPISYLAMNSMSQGLYKRPDIASRLLLFRTKRLDQVIPQSILERDIITYRNQILSEVLDNLKDILPYINDEIEYMGSFRLADFANLGIKINKAFGQEKTFEQILLLLSQEQQLLPLEDSALVDLLDRWLIDKPSSTYVSTSELYNQLRIIAENHRMQFPFENTTVLGRILSNEMENLKQIFTIEHRKGSRNRSLWFITNK